MPNLKIINDRCDCHDIIISYYIIIKLYSPNHDLTNGTDNNSNL